MEIKLSSTTFNDTFPDMAFTWQKKEKRLAVCSVSSAVGIYLE
jgi:hypothetical protein